MFYGIVTRARKQLVLTYPVVTAEGQPLSPSPYLSGLMELFDPNVAEAALEEQLDPVPRPERVLTPADARVRGMFEASGRPPGECSVPRATTAGWRPRRRQLSGGRSR